MWPASTSTESPPDASADVPARRSPSSRTTAVLVSKLSAAAYCRGEDGVSETKVFVVSAATSSSSSLSPNRSASRESTSAAILCQARSRRVLSCPNSEHKRGRDEPHNTLLAALDCMSGMTDTAAGVLLPLDIKSGHTCNQQPTRPLGEGGHSALEHLVWDVPANSLPIITFIPHPAGSWFRARSDIIPDAPTWRPARDGCIRIQTPSGQLPRIKNPAASVLDLALDLQSAG